jgi:hypothetical protein
MVHLSYSQIFWVCGTVAALAGAFVTWSRPAAVPDMLARWRNPPDKEMGTR